MTRLERHVPHPRDFRPLLTRGGRERDATARRLARAHTVWDLRRIAQRRTPTAPFDYTDGAADAEIALRRAREAFDDLELRPRILRDVATTDTSATVLGARSALPFGTAPTGFTRMMHSAGERAVATAAQQAGIPFCLSTLATASVEDVAAEAPRARRWFQLYPWKDRELSLQLLSNAAAAGFDVLLVTVDVPVGGNRLRDLRNGMTIPPRPTLRTFLNASRHWHWWFDFLTTEPYRFAFDTTGHATVHDIVHRLADPTITFDDLAWLRAAWDGPLVVKGVQTVDDARRLVDHGVDGIVVSTHGGRQLDRVAAPLHLLPHIVEAVGRHTTVILDTGIMSGTDIVAALALGADFTLVGRAVLYGLMAGGQEGVERSIHILATEIRRTMQLLGVTRLDQLERDHVHLFTRRMSVRAG